MNVGPALFVYALLEHLLETYGWPAILRAVGLVMGVFLALSAAGWAR
jgi:hypothetical protein